LLLAVIAFAALARKLRLPYPIVLVLAGLVRQLLARLPGSRSSQTSSLRGAASVALRGRWSLLARVLIFTSSACLAGRSTWSPSPWLASRFGSFICRLRLAHRVRARRGLSTTDAIAATAIARRMGLRVASSTSWKARAW